MTKILTIPTKEASERIFRIVDLYTNDLGNQLKLKGESELFKLVNEISQNEFDPTKAKPLQYISFPGFKKLLNWKVRKFYKNKTQNTILEFVTYKSYDKYRDPFKYYYYKLLGYLPFRLGVLCNYVQLGATIKSKDDIKLCLRRLAKLFTFLAEKEMILATFGDVIALPLTHETKKDVVIFGLWICCEAPIPVGSMESYHPFKPLNKIVGFDVFTNEGDYIDNFDWEQIDKLTLK